MVLWGRLLSAIRMDNFLAHCCVVFLVNVQWSKKLSMRIADNRLPQRTNDHLPITFVLPYALLPLPCCAGDHLPITPGQRTAHCSHPSNASDHALQPLLRCAGDYLPITSGQRNAHCSLPQHASYHLPITPGPLLPHHLLPCCAGDHPPSLLANAVPTVISHHVPVTIS